MLWLRKRETFMRRILKILTRLLLVLIIAAAAAGFYYREEIQRLNAVNSLFKEEKIIANFSNMRRAFLSTDLPRGDTPVTPLPNGTPMDLSQDVTTWITDRTVTALVVLKDGGAGK
jgi:glucan phosphoethanolaminetransferase (alkaline phosphatase superfamily)